MYSSSNQQTETNDSTQEDSFENESAVCNQAVDSYKGSGKVRGGLWPDGKIYYKIGNFTKKPELSGAADILDRVKQAIEEWNITNSPHCKFINIEEEPSPYYVTFEQVYEGTPRANVGCWYGQIQIIELPENYPSGSPVRIACILHEMMHCAGFEHEHSRPDRDFHCTVKNKDEKNFSTKGVISVGQYDYYSLMHYEEVPGLAFNNKELKRLADKSPSFSAGDRAAIKIFYSPKGTHHGEWHKPCDPSKCSDKVCACGNCGLLKGGVCCGYWGRTGHWTCCMNEKENSKCATTHTGFWHAKCVNKQCTLEICYCRSCGGGCTYKGSEAHWNCCNAEAFKSVCKNDFIKKL